MICNSWRRVVSGIVIGAILAGCDRPEPTVAETPATLPATAAAAPASAPAVPGVIFIDQQRYDIPPVVVVLQNQDESLLVQIMTNDPPEAARDGYQGNSLLLTMPLEGAAEGNSPENASWQIRASNRERIETIDGIVLHSRRKVLQPYDAVVSVRGDAASAVVFIRGTFLEFDDEDANVEARQVAVTAELMAQVRSQEKANRTAEP